MGDVGDYWNDVREHKRAVRMHWHECPNCERKFGTGTKVAPGCDCRNCGWRAPGKKGDDHRQAYRRENENKAERWRANIAAKNFQLCGRCGAFFIDLETLEAHEDRRHLQGGV